MTGRRRQAARLAALLAAGLLAAQLVAPGRVQGEGERVSITVLATTDVHGNVWPYDYLRARPAERGLAKVATYVKQVRARQPHTLLIDSGDTFQGTPLAYYYAREITDRPNPVVAAMNAMRYDLMAVGNHEFNFGLPTLWRLKEQANFPILGANVVSTYHDRLRDFQPYVIRNLGGVRVAILGMVTPAVPRWDPPEHRVGYRFRDLVETAREWVPKLRPKADLLILAVHSGLGRDPETGEALDPLYPEEDRVWDIAEQVPGIDAIFFGHTHQELAGKEVNGVLLVQARNWAQSLAEAEFVLARDGDAGSWRLVERHSRLVPMDASVAPDADILELTRSAHEQTERTLNTVVAQLDTDLNGQTGRVEDHPLVELIQRAQLHYGQADVSLAALFSTWTRWTAGPITVRDVYSLYFYENQLYTVEITGKQLKDALEYSARSFKSYPWPEGASPFADVMGYNFDMAEGVTYKVNLSRPPGERIVDLSFAGSPLAPERKLRLALNSYRWSGGGAYDMLRHAKVLQRADREVRELIVDYLREQKKVPTTADHNWEFAPPAARQALLDWATQPPPQRAAALPASPYDGRSGWTRRDTGVFLLILLVLFAYIAARHRRWKKVLG